MTKVSDKIEDALDKLGDVALGVSPFFPIAKTISLVAHGASEIIDAFDGDEDEQKDKPKNVVKTK